MKVELSNIDEGTSTKVTEEIKKEIENGPEQL
ncbi:hypothetical protein FHT21_002201 [Pedobacter sp. SG908]|nr:hypothetical protein [Pedobacter sp. SG908]